MRFPQKPLKPPPSAAAAYIRHYSTNLHPTPPQNPLQPSSTTKQTLTFLKTCPPDSWSTDPNLPSLLSSLTAPSILKITRHLPNYNHALHFLHHLKSSPAFSDHLPLTLQAVIEHAVRGYPFDSTKLQELILLSKQQGITLSYDASVMLVKSFARLDLLPEMMAVFDSIDREERSTQLYNSVISKLLWRGSVDDAVKLLDEMLEKETKTPPNLDTVEIVFSNAFRRDSEGRRVSGDEIDKIIAGFGQHGVSLKGTWFRWFVNDLCRDGEFDKAWELVRKVMDAGCEVDAACCNVLLTVLGRGSDFERMNLLTKEMKEKDIRPDVRTYGIMIKHLCRGGRVDQALEVLEKMRGGEFGVEPDIVIYNIVIDGLCKVGRQDDGLKLMERMMLETPYMPDAVTYNCLIDGFFKAGDIDKGHELFDKVNAEGEINLVTYNTMINALCRYRKVGSALEVFRRMREKGLEGDLRTYTTLINAFCNAENIEKAMELFDEMRSDGCSPDAGLYYRLILAHTKAGRMDGALNIVSKMKESGFCLDLYAYNSLIYGFCRTDKLDKVTEIIKEMEDSCVKPDLFTYNTLISLFCRKEDFAQAHRMIKKMIDDGLTLDVVTYGTIIHGYCLQDNLKAAMKLFRDLTSYSKIRPNTVMYNVLIEALCKTDDVESAISLMDDMKNRRVEPDTITYNALFRGLQKRHMLEKALEYMDQMTEEACYPNYFTMRTLTGWLSAAGESEKLRKFVHGFKDSGIQL